MEWRDKPVQNGPYWGVWIKPDADRLIMMMAPVVVFFSSHENKYVLKHRHEDKGDPTMFYGPFPIPDYPDVKDGTIQ